MALVAKLWTFCDTRINKFVATQNNKLKMKTCCVPTCKTKWTKGGVNKKYHSFPKEKNLRELWIQASGIIREPKMHTSVCSDHFKTDDYTLTHYGDFPGQLRRGSVPSRNLPNGNTETTSTETSSTSDNSKMKTFYLPIVEFVAVDSEPMNYDEEPHLINHSEKVSVETKDASTMAKVKMRSLGTQSFCMSLRMNFNLISDSELIYTTGFERCKFNLIFNLLETYCPISENIACVKKDSLLVTLFLLRHNLNFSMIEFIFGFSRVNVSAIAAESVQKLHSLLSRNDIWDPSFKLSKPFVSLMESIEMYWKRKK